MGFKYIPSQIFRNAMDNSASDSNNEQDTVHSVTSFIKADNTEASVPSTSNISASKEQLKGKENPKSLLDYYDGIKSTDKISLQREKGKWRRKINSCYTNFQCSNLTCKDSRLPDNLPQIMFDRRLYFK